jgi:hypothetical protein
MCRYIYNLILISNGELRAAIIWKLYTLNKPAEILNIFELQYKFQSRA